LLEDGRVILVGNGSADIYDSDTNTLTAVATPYEYRYAHTATRLGDGNVLVAGGDSGAWLPTAEIYTPALDAWQLAGPMARPRAYHAAAPLPDGSAVVVGGFDCPDPCEQVFATRSAEMYSVEGDVWTSLDLMAVQRGSVRATVLQ